MNKENNEITVGQGIGFKVDVENSGTVLEIRGKYIKVRAAVVDCDPDGDHEGIDFDATEDIWIERCQVIDL